MIAYSLTLKPYEKPSFTIKLSEDDGHKSSIERMVVSSVDSDNVFSDLTYEFIVNGDDISTLKDVKIFMPGFGFLFSRYGFSLSLFSLYFSVFLLLSFLGLKTVLCKV